MKTAFPCFCFSLNIHDRGQDRYNLTVRLPKKDEDSVEVNVNYAFVGDCSLFPQQDVISLSCQGGFAIGQS